ncbi:hypothetical protein NIES4075_72960 [Tolypothrix sp. NIES-4075]|uniref:hypothetical protein n=1 Tax=Tolypothrix sp. NIES-4075 TaxID=2005459 RepID=UPI000B63E21F|nr:hypothetical protein [Tolypothrix sp. NIES-4075]GAX46275.1 hypothetical protein NIES4075_72960 [Tolypothrix sp. NIES-4075]
MADNRYQIEFTDDGQDRSINFSKIEAEYYFPVQVNLLENSPCSACNLHDAHGVVSIEKTQENDEDGR